MPVAQVYTTSDIVKHFTVSRRRWVAALLTQQSRSPRHCHKNIFGQKVDDFIRHKEPYENSPVLLERMRRVGSDIIRLFKKVPLSADLGFG